MHNTCKSDIVKVVLPDEHVVNKVPVLGPRLHPTGFELVGLLEGCVSNDEAFLHTEIWPIFVILSYQKTLTLLSIRLTCLLKKVDALIRVLEIEIESIEPLAFSLPIPCLPMTLCQSW